MDEIRKHSEALCATTDVAQAKAIVGEMAAAIQRLEAENEKTEAQRELEQETAAHAEDMGYLRAIEPLIIKRIKKVQKTCPTCGADCKKINVIPKENGWTSFNLYCTGQRCVNRYRGYDDEDPRPFDGITAYNVRIVWKAAGEKNIYKKK